MKTQIRKSVFETNSSSTHSITIEFGDYYTFNESVEDDCEYIYIDNEDVEYILEHLPSEILEKELERRKNENTNQE